VVANVVLDISSHQHPTTRPITWSAVAAAPVKVIGVAIKATQGTDYTNPFYAADAEGAQAVGIPPSAYHFAGFTVPGAEAAYFRSVAGDLARILDAETSGNAAWIEAFWAALGGSATAEADYGSASTLPRVLKEELWPADYSANPGFGALWQAGDNLTVPGIPAPVDYSVVLTAGAFERVFGVPAPQPAPDPTPAPSPAPAPTPTPTPAVKVIQVSIGATGDGWTKVAPGDFTANDVMSVVPVNRSPNVVGRYVKVAEFDGITAEGELVFIGGDPGTYGYRVWIAPGAAAGA